MATAICYNKIRISEMFTMNTVMDYDIFTLAEVDKLVFIPNKKILACIYHGQNILLLDFD